VPCRAVLRTQVKRVADKGPISSKAAAAVAAPAGYNYDRSSGYYYNADTGLYWDSSSGSFYNSGDQKWYNWDEGTGQYTELAGNGA